MNATTNGDAHGSERVETVIIGGGQAGLSTAYHLGKLGGNCVILDANPRVGDSWRRHWDSLRLYSPARYDGLPGMPFPADEWAFPGKDEVADYLAAYAVRFQLPFRGGCRVDTVTKEDDRFLVTTGDRRYEAGNVVVAAGTFGPPYTPALAAELDPAIRQLHSADYKRPGQLTDGPVLVVGASHSGSDIAYETAPTHHTLLSGRDTGQIPFELESKRMKKAFPVLWFVWNRIANVSTPMGRKMRPEVRKHGGLLLRVRNADLAAAGVERVGKVAGTRDGMPMLGDGRVLDVANVVWATGFQPDFSWIRPPVVGDDGWPLERRGVVADAPGLYFVGLSFQRAFASMLIGGVGTDAEYVAKHIHARSNGVKRTKMSKVDAIR